MIDTNLWFMFPVGVIIATVAMMAGIGGAVLFAPFFMLVLKLDPLTALGAGLVIEVFGFSSGMIGYWRKKVIDFDIGRQLIIFTIPAAIAGVILGRVFPVYILKVMLALLLLYLSYQFLLRGKKCEPKHPRATGISVTHEKYMVAPITKGTTFLGGLLLGMISAGLGEINEYNFLRKMGLPVPSASGTSVFIVAISAAVGVFSHAYFLVRQGELSVFTNVISILVFTVPAVIVGAQIGVRLSGIINVNLMSKIVGALFLILAVLTFLLMF